MFALFVFVSAQAQDVENVRVLRAVSYPDGSVSVDVEVANGQGINSAEVLLPNDEEAILTIDAESALDNWVIADASFGAVNIAPVLQSALTSLYDARISNHTFNLIIFGDEIQNFFAEDNELDFAAVLDVYNPSIQQSACVADAVKQLPEADDERVQRILLLVGEVDESCALSIETTGIVDIVQLSSSQNPELSNLASRQNGTYLQANIQSFSTKFAQIESLWQAPIYRLSADIGRDVDTTVVVIKFEDGEVLNVPVEFVVTTPTPVPTLVPSDTALPTAIETATPTETETSVPSETATPTVTVTASPTLTVTDSPVPTETATSEMTDEAAIGSNGGIQTEAAPETTPSPDGSTLSRNFVIYAVVVLGGVAAILVVVVVLFALRVNRRSDEPTLEQTSQDVEETTEENELDSTHMLPDESESTFDKTEFVSLEEVSESAKMRLIGYLYHDDSGKTYEIFAPKSILGRKAGVAIYIASDKQISREHVMFSEAPDKSVWVTRITQNPVLINEAPIEKSQQLNSGDVMQLSKNLRLRFQEVKNDD